MWLTPSSTAWRSTATDCPRSLGAPSDGSPVSRIAPNPRRLTARSPSRQVPAAFALTQGELTRRGYPRETGHHTDFSRTVQSHHQGRLRRRATSATTEVVSRGRFVGIPACMKIHFTRSRMPSYARRRGWRSGYSDVPCGSPLHDHSKISSATACLYAD